MTEPKIYEITNMKEKDEQAKAIEAEMDKLYKAGADAVEVHTWYDKAGRRYLKLIPAVTKQEEKT
jgi:hypothetical protein